MSERPPATRRAELAGAAGRPIAGYAADKKAIDIVELDLRGVLGYTDYFVICSGNTDRQAKAIHDGIHEGMKKEHGLLPRRVEGLPRGALGPHGLPRRGRPRLHARRARLLPARAALGRGAPRARSGLNHPKPPSRAASDSGAEGARTPDLLAASQTLSQLSYSPWESGVYRAQ